MAYYENSGQVNDEAISIAGGRTFQVIQLADSEGNIINPASGELVFDGEVSIGTEVEIANDEGNPIPTSVPVRTPTTTSVTSTASSTTVLAVNTDRKGISVHNQSTATLYLSFTSPATTANSFLGMAPGSVLFLDQQLIVTNAIYGIWSSANGTAQVTEYV
jgi:hypothetical protein